MKKRKQYLIDKNFQLKSTIFILGTMSVVIIVIIASIGFIINNNNKKLENIILIQNNVVESLLTISQTNQDRSVKVSINKAAENHYKNIDSIKKIINHNTAFLTIIIIIAVIQYFILFYIFIKKTHKISGPAFVMSRYIKDVLDGKEPELRSLRKGDELVELHDLVVRLIDYIKINKRTK